MQTICALLSRSFALLTIPQHLSRLLILATNRRVQITVEYIVPCFPEVADPFLPLIPLRAFHAEEEQGRRLGTHGGGRGFAEDGGGLGFDLFA